MMVAYWDYLRKQRIKNPDRIKESKDDNTDQLQLHLLLLILRCANKLSVLLLAAAADAADASSNLNCK